MKIQEILGMSLQNIFVGPQSIEIGPGLRNTEFVHIVRKYYAETKVTVHSFA